MQRPGHAIAVRFDLPPIGFGESRECVGSIGINDRRFYGRGAVDWQRGAADCVMSIIVPSRCHRYKF
jgi:hypothetical protein